MTRIRLRDPQIPSALHGWLLVDQHGRPRYWSTVWSALEAASLEESTLGARLAVIEQFYRFVAAQLDDALNLRRTRRPETVRALPAVVLEELYDLISPASPRNPFRNESLRWRNFALILLMLHQGLRRGEALVLAVDALREAIRPGTGEARFWLDVTTNPYEESDPRLDDPSLKNINAIRQIPVAENIAAAIETYISNYRGKQSHSFLNRPGFRRHH